MDLGEPLREHDTNKVEDVDAGEGVGVEGDVNVEDE